MKIYKEKKTISKSELNPKVVCGNLAIFGAILIFISTLLFCITPLRNLPSFDIMPLLIFGWVGGALLFMACGLWWCIEVFEDF